MIDISKVTLTKKEDGQLTQMIKQFPNCREGEKVILINGRCRLKRSEFLNVNEHNTGKEKFLYSYCQKGQERLAIEKLKERATTFFSNDDIPKRLKRYKIIHNGVTNNGLTRSEAISMGMKLLKQGKPITIDVD